MGASNWVHLDVAMIHRMTDKAMQVETEDGEMLWLPLSQVCSPEDYSMGDVDCTVSITEWIAREKGIDV